MHRILAFAVCTAVAAVDPGLRDHPIATARAPVYLDGQWIASSGAPLTGGDAIEMSVPAQVPGDLLTDLQNAGVIPDPWLDITWIEQSSLWTENVWTYSTNFTVESDKVLAGASELQLVFEGVKMGATVRVNGQTIGTVNNQFLRYTFPLDSTVGLLSGPQANLLEVIFADDVAEDGRFMACTGGWDWAPYSYTSTGSSNATTGFANTLSKGIWKSVYLVETPLASVAITHLTPHTLYQGEYPTAPLEDGAHGGFKVNVTAHLWAPAGGAKGSLTVKGSWGSDADASASSGELEVPAGESKVSLQLSATAAQIKLWWPTGEGAQPLYNVSASWAPSAISAHASSDAKTVRRIGFRVFTVVTINDTDAATVASNASAEGSGTHGMFFRINGAALYSRGANMVPMEELEGRMSGEAHRILVKSSADAGMNTLRIWGGGMFLPTEFYEACDDYGVLVYHDMQYASTGGGSHGPIESPAQEAELRHQIRRLSHHPSIVLWDGANEVVVSPLDQCPTSTSMCPTWPGGPPETPCNSTGGRKRPKVCPSPSYLFATFVMTIVAQEDQSRVVWPSSPAAGWVTGVNMLWQTPNGKSDLTTHGGGEIWNQGIETHAPYQLGSGWPTVNGGVRDHCFDNAGTGNGLSVPVRYRLTVPGVSEKGGVAHKNIYASEFGTSGASSFESMSSTLSPKHWGLHGGMPADNCSDNGNGRFDQDFDDGVKCIGEHICHPHDSATGFGGNPMTQRNYGCDGPIRIYFGNHTTVDLSATGEEAFKGQLYQCQIVQAFVLKQVYENRRASNAFGHLVWMLNEIWPTVGWGSLEYGAQNSPGQVVGGRWKPLHYFYKNSLMADVMATCGDTGDAHGHPTVPNENQCYLSNHRASRPFNGTVTLTSYDYSGDGTGKIFLHRQMSLPEGPGAIEWFGPPQGQSLPAGSDHALISTVRDETGAIVSEHMVQLVTPEHINAPVAKVSFEIASQTNADGTIDITVTSDKVALWVTLSTLAQGRFSDNAFFLPATAKTVQFIPFGQSRANLRAELEASLRVEDYSMYRSLTPAPPPPPPTHQYTILEQGQTCESQGMQVAKELDCAAAADFFKYSYTGTRKRDFLSGCFCLVTGQWAGNCNYNTNTSASGSDDDARAVCIQPESEFQYI